MARSLLLYITLACNRSASLVSLSCSLIEDIHKKARDRLVCECVARIKSRAGGGAADLYATSLRRGDPVEGFRRSRG